MTTTAATLALLADLASAAAGASTRLVLARRVAEAIDAHAPLAWLALGWAGPADVLAEVVEARASEGADAASRERWAVVEARRRVAGTRAREAMLRGRPVDVRLELPSPSKPRPSARARAGRAARAGLGVFLPDDAGDPAARAGRAEGARAARAGARRLLVLPLVLDGNAVGFVGLGLRAPSEVLEGEALRRAVSATLLAGHRTCATIERVAEASRRAHEDAAGLRRRLAALDAGAGLVARSAAMRRVVERADLVAGHDTPVLFRGESGTGKGELARWLHGRSRRARGPFVHVDCGALPEALIESELFGHERGAFTGASARHVGRFERARGGTIFLDEVAELPLAVQVKLLRVLQDGEVEPIGGERSLRIDARVIAATHRPLEAMVEAGALRADLLFRLDVFPIVLPPLRDRPEDIPPLAAALLIRIAARQDRPPPALTPAAAAALARRPWPGNVRELGNVLERATIFARGGDIDVAALDEAAPGGPPRRPSLAPPRDEAPVETFEVGVRAVLARALRAAQGRIWGEDGAAALLAIPPTTLQTKMRALGLRRAEFMP